MSVSGPAPNLRRTFPSPSYRSGTGDAVRSSLKVLQGLGSHMLLRDVPSPGVHDLAALLQQVGAAVGGFDGVLDDMR